MDFTATLTAAEIDALCNLENQSLQHAAHKFEQATAVSGHNNEGAFEKSLRVKNTLDVFEDTSRMAPNGQAMAVLMNCEYQLWRLNANTPLEHNPFLSHWVEAIQRLDTPGLQERSGSGPSDTLSTEIITATRVLWIKLLLQRQNFAHWLDNTPLELSRMLHQTTLHESFDLKPYIRMLEDEGIYEKTPEPEAAAMSSHALPQAANPKDYHAMSGTRSQKLFDDPVQRQKDEILSNLKEQPEVAIFEITRLPVTLTFLDFLTTILTDRVLEKHGIDPAPIITQYIQHALRTVERMGRPPSPSAEGNTAWPAGPHTEHDVLEYGKEAQTRYILLLLLFIKSLIRKSLVEMDVLFYEIAEITVRYVWIKEVREFRTWAEEGIEVNEGG